MLLIFAFFTNRNGFSVRLQAMSFMWNYSILKPPGKIEHASMTTIELDTNLK